MDIERRDNDKLVEEHRKEADDIEGKVSFFISFSCLVRGIHPTHRLDGRTPQEK